MRHTHTQPGRRRLPYTVAGHWSLATGASLASLFDFPSSFTLGGHNYRVACYTDTSQGRGRQAAAKTPDSFRMVKRGRALPSPRVTVLLVLRTPYCFGLPPVPRIHAISLSPRPLCFSPPAIQGLPRLVAALTFGCQTP